MATIDTERYVRITLLTFEGGNWICKKILNREVVNRSTTLDTLLCQSQSRLNPTQRSHGITQKQYELLFPRSRADTDVDEWDLSLLVKVVLVLFETALPAQDKDDLREILRIRNEVVCHARQPSLQQQEFTAHWATLTTRITNLASNFDDATKLYVSDLVQELSLGPLDIQSSLDKLAQLCRNDELMGNVLASLRRQEQILEEVHAGVTTGNRNIEEIRDALWILIRNQDSVGTNLFRTEIQIMTGAVRLSGENEELVKLLENIILTAVNSADVNVEDQGDMNCLHAAVNQLKTYFERNDITVESAASGSIILWLRCKSLTGLENMLNMFKSDGCRYRLEGIEETLRVLLQEEVTVEMVLPEDTIEMIKSWFADIEQAFRRRKSLTSSSSQTSWDWNLDFSDAMASEKTAKRADIEQAFRRRKSLTSSSFQTSWDWNLDFSDAMASEKTAKRAQIDTLNLSKLLLKDITSNCRQYAPVEREVVLMIGGIGVGKSAAIITIAKMVNGEYLQIGRVQRTATIPSKTTDLLVYKNCGKLVDVERKPIDQRFDGIIEKISPFLPDIIDVYGLPDIDTPALEEVLDLLIAGNIPPGTSIVDLQRYQEKHGVGYLKTIFKKQIQGMKVTTIVFVHSCTAAVPSELIKCLHTAMSSRRFSDDVMLLITHYDRVDLHKTDANDSLKMTADDVRKLEVPIGNNDDLGRRVGLQELERIEDKLASQFGKEFPIRDNCLRWTSYCDETGYDDENIDMQTLAFFKQIVKNPLKRSSNVSALIPRWLRPG